MFTPRSYAVHAPALSLPEAAMLMALSPEEALQTLRSGWFSGGVVFEHYAPGTVAIQSFELTYRIDTKGFYRPVYLFTLACGTYNAPVMIPA